MQEEIKYTSGYRCAACNKAVGGAENSAHLRGTAVDIQINWPPKRFEVVSLALMKGVRRIGISIDHVHIDLDESLAQEIMWVE